MGDEEELRARIEAQVASRRASAPPPKRDRLGRKGQRDEAEDTPHAPEVPRSLEPIRPWLLGQLDKDEQPAPAEHGGAVVSSEQAGGPKTLGPARPWLARSLSEPADDTTTPPSDTPDGPLQPVRPWLRRPAKVEPAPSAIYEPQLVEQPAPQRGRPEPRPLSGSARVAPSPPPDTEPKPRGSRRERRQAKRELAASTALDLAGATPDPSAEQPRTVMDGADSVSRPAVVLQEHWARERESLIAERAALMAEREALLAQRWALAELRESANSAAPGPLTEPPAEQTQPAQRKPRRPWRTRTAGANEATAANVLRPRHAATLGQPAVELEHVSPFESYRTPEALGTPAPAVPAVEPAATGSAPADYVTQAPIEPVVAVPAADDEQAESPGAAGVDEDTRSGWSRRTLNWLLAPAERPADLPPPDPASDEVDAAEQAPLEREDEDRIGAPERYGLPPWRHRADVEPAAAFPVEPEPEPVAVEPTPVAVEPTPEPPGLPLWRLRPDVEPAAAHPATEPEPIPEPEPEPEPRPLTGNAESDPGPEPEPAGDAPPIDPGTDLPRRLAAANAAAMERARNSAAHDFPEDDQNDAPPSRRGISALARSSSGQRSAGIAREREEQPAKTSPLVTGKAFARSFPPAAPAPLDDDGTGPGSAKRHRVTRRGAIRMVVVLAVAVLLALLLRLYIVAPYYIPSASMEPTLHGCPGCNNDHVLVDKLSYKAHGIRRGDVVVFHRPKNWKVSENVLIKRVIGLPGDTLTTRNGIVYIDGLALDEPYLNHACQGGTINFPKKPVVVPDGQTFVMGDNRCDSSDSRIFGPVPDSTVIGRAFMIIWPLGRLHWL